MTAVNRTTTEAVRTSELHFSQHPRSILQGKRGPKRWLANHLIGGQTLLNSKSSGDDFAWFWADSKGNFFDM